MNNKSKVSEVTEQMFVKENYCTTEMRTVGWEIHILHNTNIINVSLNTACTKRIHSSLKKSYADWKNEHQKITNTDHLDMEIHIIDVGYTVPKRVIIHADECNM